MQLDSTISLSSTSSLFENLNLHLLNLKLILKCITGHFKTHIVALVSLLHAVPIMRHAGDYISHYDECYRAVMNTELDAKEASSHLSVTVNTCTYA